MPLPQKEALFSLISSVVFIVVKAFLIPDLGAFNLELTLTLLALFNVSLWAIRILLNFRFKDMEQKDKNIRFQAAMLAIHLSLVVVFVYAAVLYLLHRQSLAVPLERVLDLAYYTWISFYLFWTAGILVLCKRGPLDI